MAALLKYFDLALSVTGYVNFSQDPFTKRGFQKPLENPSVCPWHHRPTVTHLISDKL